MRYFPLGIDNEAAGTAPVAVLTAPTNIRIRALQFAVANASEVDGGCLVQVGTNATFLAAGNFASTQAPNSILANVALDARLTTSGFSNSTANITIPCDLNLSTGQTLNVFVGAISGTVAVTGIVLVVAD